MPHIYLGRWKWVTEEQGSFWQMPRADIGLGLLDLRSIPQMSRAGGIPEGFGLFVTSKQDSSIGHLLGQNLSDAVSPTTRNILASSLKLSSALDSLDLRGVLWELLNRFGDATGQIRWKPLVPTVEGNLDLHLGGFSVLQRERFDNGRHPLVLVLVREEYRRIRQECLERDSQHYKRVLSALEGKYHQPYQAFIPADLPDEGKLPHATVITESFNKVDNGLGPDLSWTTYIKTWYVRGNACTIAVDIPNGSARAGSDLSTDDHYAQIVATVLNGVSGDSTLIGAVARFSASADTGYWMEVFKGTTPDRVRLFKRIAGVETLLAGPTTVTLSLPDLVLCRANGSTIEGDFQGVNYFSISDTSITGNLRTGMVGYCGAGRPIGSTKGDDFEAGDLGAAPVFIPRIIVV